MGGVGSGGGSHMRTTLMAFAILEHVADHQPIGVSDVARSMGVPKSTAQRMLRTLEQAGWIRMRSPDDPRWILTPKVLSLGAKVGDAETLRAVAAEPMRVLGQATGETVHLVVPDGHEVVLLAKIPSVHALQPVSYVGARSPIHATSSGKAILAAMPQRERAALINSSLPQLTPNTITTSDRLTIELDRIAARGWAFNREEYQLGISSAGAAIVLHGRPIGAVTLSVPTTRLDEARAEEYSKLLISTVQQIERGLVATGA